MTDLRNGQRGDLQAAIEFIWREAELLDRRLYREWLKLWVAEGLYVVPIERDAADPEAALNLICDNAEMREARVTRLLSTASISAAASARTVRTVSRFTRANGTDSAIDIRCAQHLVEYKRDRTQILAADVAYRLVPQGDGFAIDRKVVTLVHSDGAVGSIGYLL